MRGRAAHRAKRILAERLNKLPGPYGPRVTKWHAGNCSPASATALHQKRLRVTDVKCREGPPVNVAPKESSRNHLGSRFDVEV